MRGPILTKQITRFFVLTFALSSVSACVVARSGAGDGSSSIIGPDVDNDGYYEIASSNAGKTLDQSLSANAKYELKPVGTTSSNVDGVIKSAGDIIFVRDRNNNTTFHIRDGNYYSPIFFRANANGFVSYADTKEGSDANFWVDFLNLDEVMTSISYSQAVMVEDMDANEYSAFHYGVAADSMPNFKDFTYDTALRGRLRSGSGSIPISARGTIKISTKSDTFDVNLSGTTSAGDLNIAVNRGNLDTSKMQFSSDGAANNTFTVGTENYEGILEGGIYGPSGVEVAGSVTAESDDDRKLLQGVFVGRQ